MKRYSAFILCIIMLFSVSSALFISAGAESDLEQELYDAMIRFESSIDVSAYKITPSEMLTIQSKVIYRSAELFYVNSGISYSERGDYVYRLYFRYRFTGEEYEEAKRYLFGEYEKILSTMPEGLNDYTKALYLHDYLCINFEYDLTYSIYDAYEMLQNKKGVCQAYTILYSALLDLCGIRSEYISSEEVNHAWNEVCLNGNWYLIDVTWGDPIPDAKGRAVHKYFLLSQYAFENHGSDYVLPYPCTDTRFDDAPWRDSMTQMAVGGSKAYYLSNTASGCEIASYDFNTQSVTTEATFTSTWYADEKRWSYYTKGLAKTVIYGGKIFFNTYNEIKVFDPVNGTAETLLNYNSTGGIFDMYVSGDTLYYGCGVSLKDTFTYYTQDISEYAVQIPEHVAGDWVTYDPSCTEDGYKVRYCKICGDEMEREIIPATGHSFISVAGLKPTCVDDGYSAYNECKICGYIDGYTEIPAHGHGDHYEVPVKDADIGEEGYINYICKICGEVIDTKILPMLCDFNSDGRFSPADYLLLKRHVLQTYVINESKINEADINGDGKINSRDYWLLKRTILQNYTRP